MPPSRTDEDGFSLVELIVVVVILGILSAIAIPVFLSQRQRGWDAALQSDVRNSAINVADREPLPATLPATQLSSASTTLAYTVRGDGNAFCVVGTRSDLAGTSFVFDSTVGSVVRDGSCSF